MIDTPLTGSVASRLGRASAGIAMTVLGTYIALRNLSLPARDGWIFWVPGTLWLFTMSVLCWWSTVLGHQAASRASIRASWRVGWIVGGIGFAIGFAGPLVIYPKANLGPLLGILVTGPLGFVVGALGAGVVRAVQGLR
jgi:hypothetical protein